MTAPGYWSSRFEHYDTQARAQMDKGLALVGIGLTSVTALAGIAVAYSRYEALLALPVALAIIWAVGLRMLEEYMWMCVYRDRAEKQLEVEMKLDGAMLTTWQQPAGNSIRWGALNHTFYAIVIATTVGVTVLSTWIVAINLPEAWMLNGAIAVGSAAAYGSLAAAWIGTGQKVSHAYRRFASEHH
jgi:hypothetical protein